MTRLVIEDLKAAAIEQTFTVSRRITCSTIRLNMLKVGSPSGTFSLTVKDQALNSVATSSTTCSYIESQDSEITPTNNFHGFIDFEFNDFVLNEGIFTLELSASGYTFTATDHISWVKEYENPTNEVTDGNPSEGKDYPLSFQIWEYKK